MSDLLISLANFKDQHVQHAKDAPLLILVLVLVLIHTFHASHLAQLLGREDIPYPHLPLLSTRPALGPSVICAEHTLLTRYQAGRLDLLPGNDGLHHFWPFLLALALLSTGRIALHVPNQYHLVSPSGNHPFPIGGDVDGAYHRDVPVQRVFGLGSRASTADDAGRGIFQVKDPHAPVGRASDQLHPLRLALGNRGKVEAERRDRAAVSAKQVRGVAAGRVPYFDDAIRAARGEESAIRCSS